MQDLCAAHHALPQRAAAPAAAAAAAARGAVHAAAAARAAQHGVRRGRRGHGALHRPLRCAYMLLGTRAHHDTSALHCGACCLASLHDGVGACVIKVGLRLCRYAGRGAAYADGALPAQCPAAASGGAPPRRLLRRGGAPAEPPPPHHARMHRRLHRRCALAQGLHGAAARAPLQRSAGKSRAGAHGAGACRTFLAHTR